MPATLTQRPLSGLRTGAARFARLITTPLLPDDYLELFDPLRAGSGLRARVVETRAETRDSVTLVLRPGRGWTGHIAGQYVRIGVDIDGVRHWRAYSLTSPARSDGLLTITVKAIPEGTVSNHLVRRARPGLVVQLDQAAGSFFLSDDVPAKMLFVTAGSGITPVMGMLRDRLPELRDAVLVHCAPSAADVIFGGELRHLTRQTNLRLIEWHSDDTGLLTIAALDRLVPDLGERETWACGPAALLDTLAALYADRPTARLHTERFRPAVVVTGDGGTVTFTRSGRAVAANAATPVLSAGEDAGVLMPSGCRMGICFGCVVPLRSGAVRDLRTGDVTVAAEGDGVLIQTCISAAAGDCAVDV